MEWLGLSFCAQGEYPLELVAMGIVLICDSATLLLRASLQNLRGNLGFGINKIHNLRHCENFLRFVAIHNTESHLCRFYFCNIVDCFVIHFVYSFYHHLLRH